ncbi:MAG TPA: hypothetical protein VM866_11705, partial [Pyrinomonadaceae bacterium]|nr:hypothetical protein [Pyrinomonadaceae bacterium]
MNRAVERCSLVILAWAFGLTLAASAQTDSQRADASDDKLKLTLGNRVLLQNDRDGFMSIYQVRYSPTGQHFVVIGCGFECTDNVGFLFSADGRGKRKFTARWDSVLQDKVEWSADGRKIFYYRINSTGADPPKSAPPQDWVEVDVRSGRKGTAISRRLRPGVDYSVFDAADGLVVRAAPGLSAKELGRLEGDAKGVRVTGPTRQSGRGI